MPTQLQSSYVQQQQQDQWNSDQPPQDESTQLYTHGLEALSAAALYAPPGEEPIAQLISMGNPSFGTLFGSLSPRSDQDPPSTRARNNTSSSNDLDFLVNSLDTFDLPIDPSLIPSSPVPISSPPSRIGTLDAHKPRTEGETESQHKVAYLLRLFSALPGKWYVSLIYTQ